MNRPLPVPDAPAPPVRPVSVVVTCALYAVAALLMLVQVVFIGSYRDWMLRLVEREFDLLNVPSYARMDMSATIDSSLVQTAITLVLGAAFWVVLAVFIYRGRNWARVVALVFGVLGTVVGPVAILLSALLAPPPLVYVVTAVPGWAAIVVGMVLLWRRPAKEWCAPRRVTPWRGTPAGPAA